MRLVAGKFAGKFARLFARFSTFPCPVLYMPCRLARTLPGILLDEAGRYLRSTSYTSLTNSSESEVGETFMATNDEETGVFFSSRARLSTSTANPHSRDFICATEFSGCWHTGRNVSCPRKAEIILLNILLSVHSTDARRCTIASFSANRSFGVDSWEVAVPAGLWDCWRFRKKSYVNELYLSSLMRRTRACKKCAIGPRRHGPWWRRFLALRTLRIARFWRHHEYVRAPDSPWGKQHALPEALSSALDREYHQWSSSRCTEMFLIPCREFLPEWSCGILLALFSVLFECPFQPCSRMVYKYAYCAYAGVVARYEE